MPHLPPEESLLRKIHTVKVIVIELTCLILLGITVFQLIVAKL